MSTLRDDIADLISVQIKEALKKEYDRGWKAAMEYHWENRDDDSEKRLDKEV